MATEFFNELNRMEVPIVPRSRLIQHIGKQVRRMREQSSLCIHALSVECEVPLGILQRLESGQLDDLDFMSVKRIAQALNVEIGRLFMDVDDGQHSH
jgi:hypothetical protein